MKDYVQIASKIRESVWLITPESLSVILEIADKRLSGQRFSEEELEVRLADISAGRGEAPQLSSSSKGVGVIPIHGPIFGKANMLTQMSGASSLEQFQSDFASMLDNDLVHSILLDIDSPGGVSDLVQETGEQIRAGNEIKPIYAISNTNAGSAAYWLMSQAGAGQYVTPSGSVGSIGAYTVHEDQSRADAEAGRRFTFVSAGPYKTEGNPHEPLSEEAKSFKQEQINELYGEFVNAVAQGRGVHTSEVMSKFGGGRMLSSKQALEAGMVDGILPYDKLVSQLTTPQTDRISVSMPDGSYATALWDSFTAVVDESGIVRLESAEWEHSEPGTGPTPQIGGADDQPDAGTGQPVPRRQGDPNKEDPAIGGGWRRGLPRPPDEVTDIKEGSESMLTEDQIAELTLLFGVDSDEKLISSITDMHGEMTSLREATSVAFEEKKFASDYPTVYKEHMELREKNLNGSATSFAETISTIKRPAENGELKTTKMGLSAIATDTLAEAHKKFAMGVGTVEDFETAVTAITQGGLVEYGEAGSGRKPEDPPEIDMNTPQGIAHARQQFATKVAEIQLEDKLEYGVALAQATEKYPELAKAYRIALPA